jgi:hypothetical protein
VFPEAELCTIHVMGLTGMSLNLHRCIADVEFGSRCPKSENSLLRGEFMFSIARIESENSLLSEGFEPTAVNANL